MDVTEDTVRNICTEAVFERGERYRDEGRIREIHRVDTTVTAVVSGSRQYDVRVGLATDGFAPWCDCPYDEPGACKHVVAVLLSVSTTHRQTKAIDSTPNSTAPTPTNCARSCVANSRPMRISAIGFLACVGEPTRQSVEEFRTSIDRRFEETNPEYPRRLRAHRLHAVVRSREGVS